MNIITNFIIVSHFFPIDGNFYLFLLPYKRSFVFMKKIQDFHVRTLKIV